MNCPYCGGSGKIKKPNNQVEFDRLVESKMEKAYFVNYYMAEEKAYKEVGYTLVDCPHCCKQKEN